jgi:hypothetical protein
MIKRRILNVASASGVPPYMIDPHQLAHHDSQSLSIMASKVYLHTRSVTAFNFTPSSPPRAYPTLLDYSLQVHLQTCSITTSKGIYKHPPLRPLSAFPNLHDHGLQVHFHTCSIAISGRISMVTRSRPQRVCANTVDYWLQVHLQTRSITALKCVSEFTRL